MEQGTLKIFGVPITEIGERRDVLRRLEASLNREGTTVVFTPNPEMLLQAKQHPPYRDILASADIAIPDGMGISLTAWIKTGKRMKRIPGIEVGEMLLNIAHGERLPMLFMGGRNGSAISAAERIVRRYTDLKIYAAGDNVEVTDEGEIPDPKEEKRIRDAILQTKPAVLLVGLGAPKQEQWIVRHRDAFPSVKVMIGIGGAFDVWSGRLQRAPRFLRMMGLEWLWRLMLEPKRLPRILRAVFVFPFYVFFSRTQ